MPVEASNAWAFGWDQLFALGEVLAIAGAALAGWHAARQWRLERVEIRQAELAEEALTLVHRAPDVFSEIRSPMSRGYEGRTRQRGENESAEEAEKLDRAFIPFERLLRHEDYFKEVLAIRPRLKAVFGPEFSKPLDHVLEVRKDIFIAAEMLMMGAVGDRGSEPDKEFDREMKATIWAMGTSKNPDKLGEKIQASVDALEVLAAPILRSKYRKR